MNDKIIITEFGEIMKYVDAKNTHTLIVREATKEEIKQYNKECEYWRNQHEQQNHDGSYHELED